MFYDVKQEPIEIDEFISVYEPHYFLGSKSKIPRNKTSHYVENEIERILKEGLSSNDLPLIIAWKIGLINQIKSTDKIVYYDDFDKHLIFIDRYKHEIDLNEMVSYIQINFSELADLAKRDPHKLYEKLFAHKAKYFGATYILTLVFFFTKGFCPIFDKYSEIALIAYINKIMPKSKISYKSIDSSNEKRAWKSYINYCQVLVNIFGENSYGERCVDRALWVYGHHFKVEKNENVSLTL